MQNSILQGEHKLVLALSTQPPYSVKNLLPPVFNPHKSLVSQNKPFAVSMQCDVTLVPVHDCGRIMP